MPFSKKSKIKWDESNIIENTWVVLMTLWESASQDLQGIFIMSIYCFTVLRWESSLSKYLILPCWGADFHYVNIILYCASVLRRGSSLRLTSYFTSYITYTSYITMLRRWSSLRIHLTLQCLGWDLHYVYILHYCV